MDGEIPAPPRIRKKFALAHTGAGFLALSVCFVLLVLIPFVCGRGSTSSACTSIHILLTLLFLSGIPIFFLLHQRVRFIALFFLYSTFFFVGLMLLTGLRVI